MGRPKKTPLIEQALEGSVSVINMVAETLGFTAETLEEKIEAITAWSKGSSKSDLAYLKVLPAFKEHKDTFFNLMSQRDGSKKVELSANGARFLVETFGLSNSVEIMDKSDTGFVMKQRIIDKSSGRETEEAGFVGFTEMADSGTRTTHDSIAFASTRALKRAVELFFGGDFVNRLIKEIFGDFVVIPDGWVPQNTKPQLEKASEAIASIAELLGLFSISGKHNGLDAVIVTGKTFNNKDELAQKGFIFKRDVGNGKAGYIKIVENDMPDEQPLPIPEPRQTITYGGTLGSFESTGVFTTTFMDSPTSIGPRRCQIIINGDVTIEIRELLLSNGFSVAQFNPRMWHKQMEREDSCQI